MEVNEQLRQANKKLLQNLKQSQNEISRLIIAVKHSDPRFTPAIPLSSTVASHSSRGKTMLQRTNRFSSRERKSLMKSPGILKRSQRVKERGKLLPDVSQDQQTSSSPEKYKIISDFLREQVDRGKSWTTSETASKQPYLEDSGNRRPFRTNPSPTKPTSVPVQYQPARSEAKVNFYSNENTDEARHNTPSPGRPLLGYDWIAGVVENEDPTAEHSDSFLEEIKQFRSLNRSDCQSKRCWSDMLRTPKTPVQQTSLRIKLEKPSSESPDPSDTKDPRIINYTINKRLFPVPVDPNDGGDPGSKTSPRYIRVSIPKASLISPHCYRPKDKRQNEGTDSLALPDHCAMGWQSTLPTRSAKQQSFSCLDLRSSLRPRENLTNLQLKSGQASISAGLKPSSCNNVSEHAHAIQSRLSQSKKTLMTR